MSMEGTFKIVDFGSHWYRRRLKDEQASRVHIRTLMLSIKIFQIFLHSVWYHDVIVFGPEVWHIVRERHYGVPCYTRTRWMSSNLFSNLL